MIRMIVQTIEEQVNRLSYTSKVVSVSNDGTLSTLVLKKVFHARAYGVSHYKRALNVDGTDYPIISVNYDTKEVVLQGVIPSANQATVQSPFFIHGTPLGIRSTIDDLKTAEELPLIYLGEEIKESGRFKSEPYVSAELRLFFMDAANFGKDTTYDAYDHVITPMRNLVDLFLEGVSKSDDLFSYYDVSYDIINKAKWGNYVDFKGYEKKLFNKEMAGCELRFNGLKFWNKKCN